MTEWSSSWLPISPEEFVRQKRQRQQQEEKTEARDTPEDESVHLKSVSRTKLPDGRLSLLADLGSQINIIGKNTEQEFAEKSNKRGLETAYVRRKQRLHVNGVGSDSAHCDYEVVTPIARNTKSTMPPRKSTEQM